MRHGAPASDEPCCVTQPDTMRLRMARRRAAPFSSKPFSERLWVVSLWGGAGLLSLLLGLVLGFQFWAPQLVQRFEYVQANSSENTIIYDRNDRPLATVEGLEDRHTIPIAAISPYLQKAVVAIEDRRFFFHRGMDPVRLVGAVWADLRAMAFKQGASTITQQLVKLTLLSSERTLSRKAREVFMALALEQKYPKLKVLEFYLNRVYLGYGVYGVEKAARVYFGKSAKELDLHEAAWLAALIKKPEGYLQLPDGMEDPGGIYLPVEQLDDLMARTQTVLNTLYELGWVTAREYRDAMNSPLQVFRPQPQNTSAPYFVQHVLKEMRDRLGVDQVSGRGFRVYTSLDTDEQRVAERLIAAALQEHPAASQAALLAMDVDSGFVRAMVGGRDYAVSQFNRATQARRQPGSAFKPLLYAAAFENGYTPASIFLDEPVEYAWRNGVPVRRDLSAGFSLDTVGFEGELAPEDETQVYAPANFGDVYGEPASTENPLYEGDRRMTLGRALERSSNVIAVQLLDEMGTAPLSRLTRRLGITLRTENGLCVALGCSEVTLAELTSAYAVFANGGKRMAPAAIRRITNSSGDVLYDHRPSLPEPVISEWTAFQMQRALGRVMRYGTGVRARLDRAAGGKTGTNDGPRDAWFVGFTPTVVAGVWLGNDDNTVMPNEQGGRTPAQVWKRYMEETLPPTEPPFPEPDEAYTEAEICSVTGKLATPWCPVTRRIAFHENEQPGEPCELHDPRAVALKPVSPLPDEPGKPFTERLRQAFRTPAEAAPPLAPESSFN